MNSFPFPEQLTAQMDAAKDLLIKIKEINPRFYNEFVREFLTDRLTLTNFPKDFINALHAITDITVFIDPEDANHIYVRHGDIIDKFPDYESAFHFAIALLHIA